MSDESKYRAFLSMVGGPLDGLHLQWPTDFCDIPFALSFVMASNTAVDAVVMEADKRTSHYKATVFTSSGPVEEGAPEFFRQEYGHTATLGDDEGAVAGEGDEAGDEAGDEE